MKNDSRLPNRERIIKAEGLLKERKKWLKEIFIPRIQKQFPEFEKYNIQEQVISLIEKDLEEYDEDKEIYNIPLTEFEFTLGKCVYFPDPEIESAIKEFRELRIFPNEFEEQCRKHYLADGIKWNEAVLEKTKEINARTTELLTEMYEKSKLLRDILNKEYEKGNKLFADFDIAGKIVYTHHNLKLYPENENYELARLLCEMTNYYIPSHRTLLNWDGRGEKSLEEVLFLSKDLKNWNIEIFSQVPDEVPINYYMHSVFMDGGIYNLYDMLNMKPEDFQPQLTIRTWDYLPEREDD